VDEELGDGRRIVRSITCKAWLSVSITRVLATSTRGPDQSGSISGIELERAVIGAVRSSCAGSVAVKEATIGNEAGDTSGLVARIVVGRTSVGGSETWAMAGGVALGELMKIARG